MPRKYLTEKEISRFLNAAQEGRYGTRDYALMLLTYHHGLRVSELINLRIADIDLPAAKLYIKRLKGSSHSEHTLNLEELKVLKRWIWERTKPKLWEYSPYLFVSERGGHLTRQAVNHLVEKTGFRIGLKVHPQMLRHSCGHHLANKGHDINLIADYLGHRELKSFARYVKKKNPPFGDLW